MQINHLATYKVRDSPLLVDLTETLWGYPRLPEFNLYVYKTKFKINKIPFAVKPTEEQIAGFFSPYSDAQLAQIKHEGEDYVGF